MKGGLPVHKFTVPCYCLLTEQLQTGSDNSFSPIQLTDNVTDCSDYWP